MLISPPTEPAGGRSASSHGVGTAAFGDGDEHPDPSIDPRCEVVIGSGDREEYLCWRAQDSASDGEETGDPGPHGGDVAADDDGDDQDDEPICWYWVTVIRVNGEIISQDEELLFCEDGDGGGPGGGGGGCNEEQRDLADEYRGLGGLRCTVFSTSYGHLILQDSDTENGKHKGYGLVRSRLARGYARTESHYGKGIDITSGYRCPNGDRWAGGSGRGHHVWGRAVDFVPATVNDEEWEALKDAAIAAGAVIIDNSEYPSNPHIHARWGG